MTRMLPMMPRIRMMAKEMGTKKRVSLRIMISLSLFILVTSEALSVSTEFVMCSITSTPIMITSSAAILLLYTLVAIGAEKKREEKVWDHETTHFLCGNLFERTWLTFQYNYEAGVWESCDFFYTCSQNESNKVLNNQKVLTTISLLLKKTSRSI